ncbi:vesicle-trafficking protein SEC22b-like isoform X7 [Halichondria panicea]|uniref:vesicle-trafficking protein SEC22b-like isoform X7 n=1 Tax=Halichondria panicea TaxID=6063 RepID=UPI00312BBDF3
MDYLCPHPLSMKSLAGIMLNTNPRPSRYSASCRQSAPLDAQSSVTRVVWCSSKHSPVNVIIASCYILEEGICYLALCDPTYPAKLAFNYLENLHKDFSEQHGNDVHKASRPYHFIEFDLSDKVGKLVDHSCARG